jgi:hypothetical protein
MSRILTTIMVLTVAAPAQAQSAEAVLDGYREKTSVIVRCARPAGEQIVVCGRRAADKWRVPFLGFAPGDPAGDSVSTERNRLVAAAKLPCGQGAIIANCGPGVGVSTKMAFGAGGVSTQVRPLAD